MGGRPNSPPPLPLPASPSALPSPAPAPAPPEAEAGIDATFTLTSYRRETTGIASCPASRCLIPFHQGKVSDLDSGSNSLIPNAPRRDTWQLEEGSEREAGWEGGFIDGRRVQMSGARRCDENRPGVADHETPTAMRPIPPLPINKQPQVRPTITRIERKMNERTLHEGGEEDITRSTALSHPLTCPSSPTLPIRLIERLANRCLA